MDGDLISRSGASHEPAPIFSYDEAFSRNLGWVTPAEQQILRRKRIAIAGSGGVGGSHLLTLTRLGVGAFNIADFDKFELANFNRQAGAMVSSVGQPKAATVAGMARDINPTLDLELFPDGIDETNLDKFLDGVDIYVDALDFFVLELRSKLFARCRALGIPAITAAPLGVGTAYLIFMPNGMSFEQYFRLSGLSPERQSVNFALGLAPKGFHRGYLMDASRLDLNDKRGPSTVLACELCAGVAGAEVLKILLKRGRVRAAPWYHHFDAYYARWKKGWMPGGNANPVQRAKLAVAYRLSEKLSRNARAATGRHMIDDLDHILERARWTPSGDNTQPWRFERRGDSALTVHIRAAGDLFDYRGSEPTLLAAGMLLETIRLAATERGRGMEWHIVEAAERVYRAEITLPRDAAISGEPLAAYIPIRSVNRWPYRTTRLRTGEKAALAAALGPHLQLQWQERLAERWQATKANALSSHIRLALPEAFEIHREILDWDRDFSPDGVPGRAIGQNVLSRQITRWVMRDWRRMAAVNRIGAAKLSALEMDVLPSLFCGAHFTILGDRGASTDRLHRLVEIGGGLQRFWLTATSLGLALQPGFAALWFSHFSRRRIAFTSDPKLIAKAGKVALLLDELTAGNSDRIVFRGRLGHPFSARINSRSLRREIGELNGGSSAGHAS